MCLREGERKRERKTEKERALKERRELKIKKPSVRKREIERTTQTMIV